MSHRVPDGYHTGARFLTSLIYCHHTMIQYDRGSLAEAVKESGNNRYGVINVGTKFR